MIGYLINLIVYIILCCRLILQRLVVWYKVDQPKWYKGFLVTFYYTTVKAEVWRDSCSSVVVFVEVPHLSYQTFYNVNHYTPLASTVLFAYFARSPNSNDCIPYETYLLSRKVQTPLDVHMLTWWPSFRY